MKSYFGWSFVKLKGNEIELKSLTGLKNMQRGQWKRNEKVEIRDRKYFNSFIKFNGEQMEIWKKEIFQVIYLLNFHLI